MGTIKGQQSPGRYMDGYLHENLKTLAKKITDDMTFLVFVFSSTLEVGTGKSVFTQQCAEAITELVNEYHKERISTPLEFTANNLVFKPEDLIERSFKVPRYSTVILDEWEDAHYWSKLGMTLRRFFRKCRQLNLFMFCIIPNFFECPMGYAVSRSVCAIDVHFAGEFERGFFKFYNFETKKDLYVKGKKTQNYGVVRPNFTGRFTDGYAIPEAEYREAKRKDLDDYDDEEAKKKDPLDKVRLLALKIKKNLPFITNKVFAESAGVSETTIYEWFKEAKLLNEGGVSLSSSESA
jgi:hypothetical protein